MWFTEALVAEIGLRVNRLDLTQIRKKCQGMHATF